MKGFNRNAWLAVLALCAAAMAATFPAGAVSQPEPAAKPLWDCIQRENYVKWDFWPGTDGFYDGPHIVGDVLRTYVNRTAFRSIKARTGRCAPGSVIVQERFFKDGTFKSIALMYKRAGYNPGAGDWFWAEYRPDGRIVDEGRVSRCIACHGVQKDNDFTWTTKLK